MSGDSAPRVGSAETVSEQSQKLVVDSLRAAAAPYSERVELLPTGALIVVLSGRATATDQAAEGARCALRLRDELPCAHPVSYTHLDVYKRQPGQGSGG